MSVTFIRIARSIIFTNLVISVMALMVISMMFGILTGSVWSAIVFPLALLSMAREGSFWGIWILSSLIVGMVWFIVERLNLRRGVTNKGL